MRYIVSCLTWRAGCSQILRAERAENQCKLGQLCSEAYAEVSTSDFLFITAKAAECHTHQCDPLVSLSVLSSPSEEVLKLPPIGSLAPLQALNPVQPYRREFDTSFSQAISFPLQDIFQVQIPFISLAWSFTLKTWMVPLVLVNFCRISRPRVKIKRRQ